jgi:alpha 1,2-mannosyltransferase
MKLKEQIKGPSNVPPYKLGIPDEYYKHNDNKTSPDRKANAAIVILGK